ncbi:MAG: hypothetical protein NTU73_10760 [Ignavibacteriae bacterium]|nr:hypothetical protein [Ignavibacteriota bacterium]
MEISNNSNTKISFMLSEFIKWMIEVVIIVGTAVALYYNLSNDFNLLKSDMHRLNKEFEEMKTEFKIHLRETK